MKFDMHRAYYILWIIVTVLFIVLFDFFRLDISGKQPKNSFSELKNYEVETVEDADAPTGIRRLYTFTLNGIEESYCELVFCCIHQSAKVYFENECIYEMSLHETGISGKSPGYAWNFISFSEEDNGKDVTIEITPVYKYSNDIVPLMYFGNRYDIAKDILLDALPGLLLSLVVIVIGFIYIFFVLYNNRWTSVEKDLSMLGFFSIQLGVWKISESEAINFLFSGYPMIPHVAFMSLMFMNPAVVLYVKELYSTRNKLIWKIPCILSFANIILTLIFQYTGIADMREMLPVNHFVIGTVMVITVIMTIYEVVYVGWNVKLKRNILCLMIAFAGGILDTVLYYVTNGSAPSMLALLGFLIFILVSGISSMHEVKQLMNVGMNAKKYEQLAYHDQLTGLYNRTAYEEHTSSEEFNPKNCIVLVMDLNNLKSCNDVLGHDKGDIYIRAAARMIKEVFDDVGYCYRMGGDEFYVLVTNATLKTCRQKIAELQEKVVLCTDVGDNFIMGIACGLEVFDSSLDHTISETARRADKAMYQDKFAIKENGTKLQKKQPFKS